MRGIRHRNRVVRLRITDMNGRGCGAKGTGSVQGHTSAGCSARHSSPAPICTHIRGTLDEDGDASFLTPSRVTMEHPFE